MRFLIVDDDDVFRGVMRRLVERVKGLEVVAEARDGYEAIDAVALGKVDAVIMDVSMPRLDGIAALRLIRQKHADLPVLMCSASDPRGEQACLNAGATAFAPKEQLVFAFDSLLERLGFTRG